MKHTDAISVKVFVLCISFLVGIFLGGLYAESGIWLVFFCLLLVGIIPWSTRWIAVGSAILIVSGYAMSYSNIRGLTQQAQVLGEQTAWGNQTLNVSGTIDALIRTNDWSRTYRAEIDSIDGKKIVHRAIALIIPPNLTFVTGDTFTALGKFRFPKDSLEFASQKNLWYQGIIAEFQVFSAKKFEPTVRSPLVRLRLALNGKLKELFPEKGYELLAGIIIGERSALDSTRKQELKSSGLMHIMVVSGSNVMMLIIVLSLLFRGFTPWVRIGIIGASIAGFALLVGGDAPVWRAALMGVVGYGFSLWGYRSFGIVLPFVVAGILAIFRPLALVYDIGFQLSFLSVISIIVFSPFFRKWFAFLGSLFDEAAALTLSATLGTLPITLYYFGGFPLVGIIANLLVEPCIPLAMYSGIITLLVSFFSPNLATWLGYIPWILSTYILEVVHFFGSNFPLITPDISAYRTEWLVLMMAVFCVCVIRFGRKE